MKARKDNIDLFQHWLTRMARFGNGQSKETAELAQGVLDRLGEARSGVMGMPCPCGKTAVTTRNVQPVNTWPYDDHCFCAECAKKVDEYSTLMKKLVEMEKTGKP